MEASAQTELDALNAMGNAKPSNMSRSESLDLRVRINMQEAWLRELKKIKKNFFEKLYAIAHTYMDVELEVFALAFIRGASDKFIMEKTGLSEPTFRNIINRLQKDIDSIVLTNDISDV